jgi:hypothetical protein
MNDDQYKNMSLEELTSTYSDYHKDVFGYRPKQNPMSKEWVITLLVELDNHMNRRTKEDLVNDGWIV